MQYDADNLLARMRQDEESDWVDRLLPNIAAAPGDREPPPRNASFRRAGDDTLSERELEALTLMSRGLSQEQTADAMCLSKQTVTTHLKGARYRLRAKNTVHACCEAVRAGLIR